MDHSELWKLELVANTFEVSVYAVFWSAYKASGYVVTDDFVEQHFAYYLHTQEVPVHVIKHCDKVLNGKEPFLYADNSAQLLA
jgi:hypothetical protein